MSGIDDPRRTDAAKLPPEAQAGLADERSIAAQEAELAALSRITGTSALGTAEGVEAILEGASPDDANRMRAALGMLRLSYRWKSDLYHDLYDVAGLIRGYLRARRKSIRPA